jgi:hypothetical protein
VLLSRRLTPIEERNEMAFRSTSALRSIEIML